jgi:disulfide bond formation protein DsbB
MTRAFAVTLNALSLYAVALVLAAAFAAQLLLHELPCPLCLLQRIQFAVLAIGLVIGLTALNVVSTLLECGFGACAEDPVVYELLKRGV